MVKKMVTDKLSIYIPQSKMAEKPVERLIKLSEKRERSVNYIVVRSWTTSAERRRRAEYLLLSGLTSNLKTELAGTRRVLGVAGGPGRGRRGTERQRSVSRSCTQPGPF